MRKLSILLAVLFTVLICSCAGNAEQKEQKEESTQEVKQETKKLSKETQEGMMAILEAAEIEIPAELEYEKVEKKSNSYVISFKNDSINEDLLTQLQEWYKKEATDLEESGWKKMVVRDNEEMMGMVFNEIIFYPPESVEIDVTHGISLGSTFKEEEMSYEFYVSAE